jgi:hypothetical protein
MPNEQTSVPLFTAGEVLTAANMNISAGTGVPVFTNTTTRDAAFGGAGEKVLAEGQLCYLSDSNIVQYYSGASWATVGPSTAGGLVLISTVTSTTAATVVFDNVFTATYTNYLILHNLKASSGIGLNGNLRLAGVTVAGTAYSRQRTNSDGTSITGARASSDSTWYGPSLDTNFSGHRWEIFGPALAQSTGALYHGANGTATLDNNLSTGYMATATAYDGIIYTTTSGTVTGTSSVYGYAK